MIKSPILVLSRVSPEPIIDEPALWIQLDPLAMEFSIFPLPVLPDFAIVMISLAFLKNLIILPITLEFNFAINVISTPQPGPLMVLPQARIINRSINRIKTGAVAVGAVIEPVPFVGNFGVWCVRFTVSTSLVVTPTSTVTNVAIFVVVCAKPAEVIRTELAYVPFFTGFVV